MKRTFASIVCAIVAFGSCAAPVTAGSQSEHLPFVSPMFGDNMVLQRGKMNTIWGWSAPGQKVRVEIAGKSAVATTDSNGRWQAHIQPPPATESCTLKITGPEDVEFHNVLVGDVWLCGGQSNMELPLSRTRNGDTEISQADHPQIRFFSVKQQPAYTPSQVVQGSWKVCSPKTVAENGGFSAVAYFFARKVRSEVNVPIGLVKDCVGGTPAETWTGSQTLREIRDFDPPLDEVQRLHARGGSQYGNYIMHWYDEFDIGQKNPSWAAPDLDERDWKTVPLPGGFSDLGVGETPSVCYFRKAMTLPDPLPAGKAVISLGVVERMDTTYINGKWVGASAWVENPRKYTIPDGILKPGRNIVTVRVFKTKPDGGFKSQSDQLRLTVGDQFEIPLAGEWKGKVSVDARAPHPMPMGFENWPVMPSVLYNGMIAPVAPLAITGVIWYQGEANANRAFQYRTLLPAMIADWRKAFGQGNLPFYIVSLPAFMHHRDTPGDDSWAEMREAQAFTARTVPDCGLAVTVDTGDANDIHPKDKKVVGERLALCALAGCYRKHVAASGPAFASVKKIPGALKLRFAETDGGLVVKGERLGEFSVAGDDHQWHWADARIDGYSVIVSCPDVPKPSAARYAWQANPTATLFNGAGLPAVPFRTDNWPLVTEKAKPF